MTYNFLPLEEHGLPEWILGLFEMKVSEYDASPSTDLIIPDCTAGLLYVFQGQLQRRHQQHNTILKAGHLYLFGQKTKAVEYVFNELPFSAMGFKLSPEAIHYFADIPGHKLTDEVVDISQMIYRHPYATHLHEPYDLLKKIALNKDSIKIDETHQHLKQIISHIDALNGQTTVKSICESFHINYKQLERLFKKFVGLTPKHYLRIQRFAETMKIVNRTNKIPLTEVAYIGGYFDQMHFIKESRHFTGKTPKELISLRPVIMANR